MDISETEKNKVQAIEMKFLRRLYGVTTKEIENVDISKGLDIQFLENTIGRR